MSILNCSELVRFTLQLLLICFLYWGYDQLLNFDECINNRRENSIATQSFLSKITIFRHLALTIFRKNSSIIAIW